MRFGGPTRAANICVYSYFFFFLNFSQNGGSSSSNSNVIHAAPSKLVKSITHQERKISFHGSGPIPLILKKWGGTVPIKKIAQKLIANLIILVLFWDFMLTSIFVSFSRQRPRPCEAKKLTLQSYQIFHTEIYHEWALVMVHLFKIILYFSPFITTKQTL